VRESARPHLLDFRRLLGELRAPFCHILPKILKVISLVHLLYKFTIQRSFENFWPSGRACPQTRRRGGGCPGPVHCSPRPQACGAPACNAPGSMRPAAKPGVARREGKVFQAAVADYVRREANGVAAWHPAFDAAQDLAARSCSRMPTFYSRARNTATSPCRVASHGMPPLPPPTAAPALSLPAPARYAHLPKPRMHAAPVFSI
jgi:hypothetical protein